MEDIKPSCYIDVEMTKFEEGCYIPKDLCSINALGEVDDVIPCSDSCNGENCSKCIVTKVFNEYARLTNQISVEGEHIRSDVGESAVKNHIMQRFMRKE